MSQAQILIERFNKADDKAQFIEDERKLQPLVIEQYNTYEYWLLIDLSMVMFTYSRLRGKIPTETKHEIYNETINEVTYAGAFNKVKRSAMLKELASRYNAVLTELQWVDEQSENDRNDFFERVTKIAHGNY